MFLIEYLPALCVWARALRIDNFEFIYDVHMSGPQDHRRALRDDGLGDHSCEQRREIRIYQGNVVQRRRDPLPGAPADSGHQHVPGALPPLQSPRSTNAPTT